MTKYRMIVFISLFITAVAALTGCASQKTTETSLTLDTIIRLSKKGEELTWQDFENYESEDVGFGLRILRYEMDEPFYVLIGGTSKEEKPFYIRLVSEENRDEYIDIRTENVKEFLDRYSTSSSDS